MSKKKNGAEVRRNKVTAPMTDAEYHRLDQLAKKWQRSLSETVRVAVDICLQTEDTTQ